MSSDCVLTSALYIQHTHLEAPNRTVKDGTPLKALSIAVNSAVRSKNPGKGENVCLGGICDLSFMSCAMWRNNSGLVGV